VTKKNNKVICIIPGIYNGLIGHPDLLTHDPLIHLAVLPYDRVARINIVFNCFTCRSNFIHHECPADLDPFVLFLSFLDRTGWNYSLLLDLLMSPETCFLLYLVRTLKHITGSWKQWTDACRNYVCSHEWTAKESVLHTEPDDGANIGATCLGNRKRKHRSVDVHKQQMLSFDTDSLDSKVGTAEEKIGNVPCSSGHDADFSNVDVSRDTAIHKSAIVDYSSSSDDEDFRTSPFRLTSNEKVLPYKSGVCENFPKKRRIDLAAPDCADRERRTSIHVGEDERLIGKSRSDSSCDSALDRAMTVLRELNRVVSRLVAKNMFPFNVRPLVRHLCRCEVLYCSDRDMV